MAKPDHSLDSKILESAKKEFLQLGYEKASLKSICEQAEVTTGAIYKRYKGKNELFSAVVASTIEDMMAIANDKASVDVHTLSDEELIHVWTMDEAYMLWWFDFLFQHHDELVLLLSCAEGTSYSNFQHNWVEMVNSATYVYFAEARRRNLVEKEISPEEMHILITAFWTTIYEPFIHGFNWEQIESYCKIVCQLFDWHHALGLKP